MRSTAAGFVVLFAFGAAACSGGASPADPSPVGTAAAGRASMAPPSASAAAASSPPPSAPAARVDSDFVVGGDRPVTVHAPQDPDPAGAPLLIALHGYSSRGSEAEEYFGLGRAAEARGVVVAYPDGTLDGQNNRFWNATDACCGFGGRGVDVADDAYLAGLIDEIAARTAIDARRVYVVGHSNGGFMSHRMACSHADRIAAIVSIAGTTYARRADCAPSEPVAILQIHGTADDVIRFEGGSLADLGVPGAPPYASAPETIAAWLDHDGCDPTLAEAANRIDVDTGVEGPDGPAETVVARSTGCDPGGFVELWTIEDGGHIPQLSSAFPDAVLDFLLAHPKP